VVARNVMNIDTMENKRSVR